MDGIDFNLAAWAADIAVMAAALVGIVAGVRKYVWKSLDGYLVNVVAVALGIGAGALLHVLTYFPTLLDGLLHGAAAGFATFLGVDAVRGILRLGK